MFNAITIGPFGSPKARIDAGLLAECLVFYGKVKVITGSETLKLLVTTCGAEELLELCNMGSLEIDFLENMTAIVSRETNVGVCHDLGLISSPNLKLSRTVRQIADSEYETSGRKADKLFNRLLKTVKRTKYDGDIIKGSQDDLKNQGYLEEAIKTALAYLAPEYSLPESLIFRPYAIPNFGIRYETNIDFEAANVSYHNRVPAKDSTLSPAYLLAQITTAEPDIVIASRGNSEFAVDPLKSKIVSSRLTEIIRKSTAGKESIDAFQELVVNDFRSIREAVNSGDRSFRDVIQLVERAHKFRGWIQKNDEDALLRNEYCKSIAAIDGADKLPTKSVRFLIMTGLATLAGLFMTPEVGIMAGIGLNTADYFLLDKLLKGWKPNQFVEGSLKPFLREK